MIIAVVARSFFDASLIKEKQFVEDLLSTLVNQYKSLKLLIIADKQTVVNLPVSSNIVFINLGSPGKTVIQKKYWREIKLPRCLKKNKADVLVSFDSQCSRSLKLPQFLLVSDVSQTNSQSMKWANMILVNSEWGKAELVKNNFINKEKVEVLTISVKEIFKPVKEGDRNKVKADYCDGKEYFLYPGSILNDNSLINFLKSFSGFKKRQQSNMKLMLFSMPGKKSFKSLSTYKYRSDVLIVENPSDIEEALLIGSAYAVIIPQNDIQSAFITLKSLQSDVPVLASENSLVREYAGDAALYFETESEKGISEKLISVYTDEGLRAELIRKGKERVKDFCVQKSANLLWNFIQKAIE